MCVGGRTDCIQFTYDMINWAAKPCKVLPENVHISACVSFLMSFRCRTEEVKCCKKAVGGRGGSAVEIIPGFCSKSCARWADQGLREEWCYPVAVTQLRAFHLTSRVALQPAGLDTLLSAVIGSCMKSILQANFKSINSALITFYTFYTWF